MGAYAVVSSCVQGDVDLHTGTNRCMYHMCSNNLQGVRQVGSIYVLSGRHRMQEVLEFWSSGMMLF